MKKTQKNRNGKGMAAKADIPSTHLLGLVADIRAAVGDPKGKLMQDDLVMHCAEMYDRVCRAEVILDRLTTGFWRQMLNENSPGESIGEMVLDYWRKYNKGAVPPPRRFEPNAKDHG
jgi:hypothetical protein